MKRLWEVGAFVVLCVVMLWVTGMWAPLKQEGRRVAERVVHGDPAGRETLTLTHGVAAGESGRAVLVGNEVRWEPEMAKTKTQVLDGNAVIVFPTPVGMDRRPSSSRS